MHLKLNKLQRLVDQTIKEEKHAADLRSEIGRVLGPVVVTEGRLHEVVAAANDRLDVLSRTGRLATVDFDPCVTTRWTTHVDPELRKFVAWACPTRYLPRLAGDKDSSVRAVVAKRLPVKTVQEMIRRFPDDDHLHTIFREKMLAEAGLPQPKPQPIGHDPAAGKKRMGQVARTPEGPALSDAWYREQALRFMYDYGQNLEYAWEEVAVRRFCASTKKTSGVDVDEAKLLKCIKDIINEKDDDVLERDALKETLDWLGTVDDQGLMTESVVSVVQEDVDPISELVESNASGEQYLSSAATLFSIRCGMLPMAIRKYRLGEGNARQTMVPVVGMLPHSLGFRAVDEKALDRFCEAWSRGQQLQGEPLRLTWSIHPVDAGKISFSCALK